jgi:hypothetical protein
MEKSIDVVKNEKQMKMLLTHFVNIIWKHLAEKKVKKIDSNYFHFVIYAVLQKNEELKKRIPHGWFYHGAYIPWVDDVLVEHFGMSKEYHQLQGNGDIKFELCETEFEV